MNKIIKIALIALVSLAIVGVAVYFFRSTKGDGGQVDLPKTNFSQEIARRVEQMANMTESDAQKEFKSLMGLIATAQQSGNVDGKEAALCNKSVVYQYAPMLKLWADQCFAQSSWSASQVDAYGADAQQLLSRQVLEPKSKMAADLNTIVQTVKDYHGAVAASHVGGCTTVAAVNAAINRAKSFSGKRLPVDVKASLSAVPGKAKDALAKNIAGSCNSLAGQWSSISYDAFCAKYDGVRARKNEYVSAVGSNSSLSSAWNALESARARAIDRAADSEW